MVRGWEGRLRLAARAIDERLKADPHQTVCHGDPKEENMLFANDVAHLWPRPGLWRAPKGMPQKKAEDLIYGYAVQRSSSSWVRDEEDLFI